MGESRFFVDIAHSACEHLDAAFINAFERFVRYLEESAKEAGLELP
jgi:hypothetical protein